MWSDDWIGLPYAERGRGPDAYDCLGLFLTLHRARFGRDLPDPGCTIREAVREDAVQIYLPRYERVSVAQEGDALLFRMAERPLHLGFALDSDDMLHIDAIAESRVERWSRASWLSKLEGIYRIV
ncbi:NlpC/P60 family protein [Salipiger abyssi]|uniref:NlpC/P60 family protein n=1 Tax=Salipiger abyssi TaxID=1250539 RepID=A0A1P8UWH5_9RHOB|nr:NlpC/P60 family protein [Salipiger abyssi]APZ53753.1 NlpC/P60 family protein [Salipiger abyssi]